MAKRSISPDEFRVLRQALHLDPDEAPRVSARLRELRNEHGWSLSQVASYCGLAGKGTPSGWETEGLVPELGLLLLLSDLYGVTLDYLIGRSGAERDSHRVRTAKQQLAVVLRDIDLTRMTKPERIARVWEESQRVDSMAFPPLRVAGLIGGLSESAFSEFLAGTHSSDVAIARFAFALGLSAELLLGK